MNLESTCWCLMSSESLGGGSTSTQPTPGMATEGAWPLKAVLPVEGEAGPHLLVRGTVRDRELSQMGLSSDPRLPFLRVTSGGTWCSGYVSQHWGAGDLPAGPAR